MFETTEIPLFPLNTVLFPGTDLPLRIFEPRYLDLVSRCTRNGTGFAVVLIRQGLEVGAAPEIHDVGGYGAIVDFERLPDGLLGITVRGERRFRIERTEVAADGLMMGQGRFLPPDLSLPPPDSMVPLVELLEVLTGEESSGAVIDAASLAWRLTARMALPKGEKQRLLEIDDPLERLIRLGRWIVDQKGELDAS